MYKASTNTCPDFNSGRSRFVSSKVGASPEYVGMPVGFLAMTQHSVVVGKNMTAMLFVAMGSRD